ncbi:putative sulfate transporter [Venturia inaequalis]|nr:putative sulfate transporter [Venturia inaequalis]
MQMQYNDFVRLISGTEALKSSAIDVDVEHGHGKEWELKKNAMIEITELRLTSLSREYMYPSKLLNRSNYLS